MSGHVLVAVLLAIALGTNLGSTQALAAAPDGLLSVPTAIDRLIQTAGKTHDELARLRLLRQLDARSDLDTTLRADLTKLLPVVDDWANGKSQLVADTSRAAENGYLCRFITHRVRSATDEPVHPPEPSPGSPLRPTWCLDRGPLMPTLD